MKMYWSILMSEIKIYILTHKKFNYEENYLYEPLLNGSALLSEDYGYTRDDTGDNISNLNPYYAELTGQYWAWKNSDVDIIGFCHYRRYLVKNIFLKKLDEEYIRNALKDHDIILPQKRYMDKTNRQEINEGHLHDGICQTVDDYDLLEEIIKEKSPEYLKSFIEVLDEKECYWFNIYICKKEIFDDYFRWAFSILEEFRKQTDFSKYEDGNTRVLGYLSERLLNVYVKKHNLKVKENFVYQTELRIPLLTLIENRFPFFQNLFKKILNLEKQR